MGVVGSSFDLSVTADFLNAIKMRTERDSPRATQATTSDFTQEVVALIAVRESLVHCLPTLVS